LLVLHKKKIHKLGFKLPTPRIKSERSADCATATSALPKDKPTFSSYLIVLPDSGGFERQTNNKDLLLQTFEANVQRTDCTGRPSN